MANFFLSMRRGKLAGPEPVARQHARVADRLAAAAREFDGRIPTVYRGPYEYSVPGHGSDYWPQNEPPRRSREGAWLIRAATVSRRPGRRSGRARPAPFAVLTAAATLVLIVRRRPRHSTGSGALRARLAARPTAEHVHVPVQDGRRRPLRARPPPGRFGRRPADDRPRGLARAPEPRRWVRRLGYVGAGRGRRAGGARRPDGALPAAHAGVGGARLPRAGLFLPDRDARGRHLAALAQAAPRTCGRPSALAAGPDAGATAAVVFLQLVVGAVMRHTKAGLAIPDFPLSFGRLVPPLESVPGRDPLRAPASAPSPSRLWSPGAPSAAVRTRRSGLEKAAGWLAALVAVQIALGAFTVLTRKSVAVTTAHVATGALLLGSTPRPRPRRPWPPNGGAATSCRSERPWREGPRGWK